MKQHPPTLSQHRNVFPSVDGSMTYASAIPVVAALLWAALLAGFPFAADASGRVERTTFSP